MSLRHSFILLFWLVVAAFVAAVLWEVYIPKSLSQEIITYTAKPGMGDEEIAKELEDLGIIKNRLFFEFNAVISGKHAKLQAGTYELSPSMSSAEILLKMVSGNTVKGKVTILEGWDAKDIADYLELKKGYNKAEFLAVVSRDFSQNFTFLVDKPKSLNIEGYLFPDTYQIFDNAPQKDLVVRMLENFDKKLTSNLRAEIAKQDKSIFSIITMASIIEKEVKSPEDKKIVSGILWKRIKTGVPLQVDSSVNYITRRNDASVAIKDTKIDSPYNTYKYYGLPKGPISNPGLESIEAAIYPTDSDYWYYLSAKSDGRTIFNKTLNEHNLAVQQHL